MTKRPVVLHITPHTRWQREGYQTAQRARLKLISLFDQLTSSLTRDIGRSTFLLDGQAVLLDDYLAVRPDQQTVLAELTQAGRLLVGPWYVSTDPWLVSAEALVRNLLAGAETAARFGPRLDVAYMPDAAGYNGQMPQILRGFGLESAVVQRGLGDVPTELWWEAPDGSQVLLIYLREGSNSATSLPHDPDGLKAALVEARDSLRQHAASNALLLMAVGDHHNLATCLPDSLESINRRFRGTRIVLDSLPDYINDVLDSDGDFPVIAGELRSSQRFPLLAGVLSSRGWIKQRNHAAQVLLERWAEPFSAWALSVGSDDSAVSSNGPSGRAALLSSQPAILSHAWRLLLQNHAHDTIRGSSIDRVQPEVESRFDQVEEIGDELTRQNLRFLAAQINTQALPTDEDALPVVVFNAVGHHQTGLVEVEVGTKPTYTAMEAVDEEGNVSPCEVFTVLDPSPVGSSEADLPVIARFVASDIPPFGYRTFVVRPTATTEDLSFTEDNGDTIENEYLSVTVNRDDGTLCLYDKQTGRSFVGLNQYRDGGDRGDTYSYCPPDRDTVISIAANTPLHPQRTLSPVNQTLEIIQIYRIPQRLKPDRSGRLPLAAQFVPISILTVLQVVPGVPRLDVEVSISNTAYDHRLRAHFPTGIITQDAYYDSQFEVVQRPISLPDERSTADWVEQPVPEQPQQAFVTVLGDETGLTIANRGLPEVAVLASSEHGTEIALTLLRSVGWLHRNDLPQRCWDFGPPVDTPTAQCTGDHTYHYSLIPHGADPLEAWQAAWAFQTPLRVQPSDFHAGKLPQVGSLVAVDNPSFVLSAVKSAANGQGLIIRGYNISDSAETVNLSLGLPLKKAEFARIDEMPTGTPLEVKPDGRFTFEAGPYQIVTMRFTDD